ncbi:MAG: site-specific integrase [Mucilaginibacter sp.]|nr:site-specific integrase [Mucilaginibacter sp.]
MQTSKSFGIHFTTRSDKVRDGKSPIYACITVNRQRSYIALKQSIDPAHWNSRKGAAKGNRSEIKAINHYLEEVRIAVGNCYKQMQLKGKLITASGVKSLYLGEDKDVYTLSRLCEYHNEKETGAIKASTMKHYHVTQRYLSRFLKANFKKNDIYLHELDHKFLLDFEVFLRNYKPNDHQKTIQHNGVMKHIVRLKKMVNIGVDLGWLDKDPFGSFRVKVHKVNRTQLTADELAVFAGKKLLTERLEAVRDMFVFSCYTGLSYIDISQLRSDNIERDGDDLWIRTLREKTLVPVDIPLLPQAVVILKKYEGNRRAIFNGRVFPVISNQKMNCYLKEIAGICGISKNMTFHMARHTFATTIALSNGVPLETVSKLLGHTKITTTQVYAKVLRNKISADMKALKQAIGG